MDRFSLARSHQLVVTLTLNTIYVLLEALSHSELLSLHKEDDLILTSSSTVPKSKLHVKHFDSTISLREQAPMPSARPHAQNRTKFTSFY